MSLLCNMLSRFVIVFLPRSRPLLISWLKYTLDSDFGALENKICHSFHCFPIYLPWSCSAVRIGKRSPLGSGLKTRKGKARENRTQEGPRTRVRTSGRTNTPGWPNLHRAGPGGGETCKKRSQRARDWPLTCTCSFSLSLLFAWIGVPSCLEDVFSFIF